MIRHIVMWKLRDGAHGLDRRACAEAVKERLEAMRGRIPGLLRVEAGVDLDAPGAAHDVVLVSDFTDREALAAYQTHPVHEEVKAFIVAAAEARAVVDYEL